MLHEKSAESPVMPIPQAYNALPKALPDVCSRSRNFNGPLPCLAFWCCKTRHQLCNVPEWKCCMSHTGILTPNLTTANFSMWPMPSGVHLRISLVPKCGVTRWTQLLLQLITGKIPPYPIPGAATYATANGFAVQRLVPCLSSVPVMAPRTVWLMIVRNPYERLLSGYLDKVVRLDSITRDPFSVHWVRQGQFNATPEHYAQFVRKFGQRRGWVDPKYKKEMNYFARIHIWPITHIPDIAVQDALWASTRSDRNEPELYVRPRLLKLERMTEWYPALVHELGISEAVSKPGWNSGCFFHSSHETCEDAINPHIPHRPHACDDGVEQPLSRTGGPTPDHKTSSCRQLHHFYDREVADVVTTLMADDLQAFDYPKWTGLADSIPW